MTPLTNNTPKRITEVSDLVAAVMGGLMHLPTLKETPKEMNAALAICELLTSMPVEWFTQMERLAIMTLISELYGDPKQFIDEIMNGNISFVNKAEEFTRGKSCEELSELVFAKHIREFGSL